MTTTQPDTEHLPATPGWDGFRWVLLLSWVVVAASTAVLGVPGSAAGRGTVRWITVLGRSVPTWVGVLALVNALAALVLLVQGPTPWRATRWAWFWWTSNPLGTLAFLVLSGRTPGVGAPRPGRRMHTGGWAFLLSSIVGTAWVNVGLR